MMHLLRKYDVAPLRFAMMRCLPQCAARHTSLGEAVIIGRSPASFAIKFALRTFANIIQKSTHCLGRQMCAFFWRRDGDSLSVARCRFRPCESSAPSVRGGSDCHRQSFTPTPFSSPLFKSSNKKVHPIGCTFLLKTNPNFDTNAPPFEVRGCKVISRGAFSE